MHDNPFMWLSNVTYGSVNNIPIFPVYSYFAADVQVVESTEFKRLKNIFKKDLKIISSKSYAKMNRAHNSSIL